jgi:hypothetical protein
MAVFTAALTIVACIQWWTAHRQWEAMHAQNEIMIAESKKTDAIIEQMRLDQRPWLYIVDPKIETIEANKPVTLKYRLKNSGHSPAAVYRVAVHAGIVSEITHPGLGDALAAVPRAFVRCPAVVPPNGGCNQEHSQGTISEEQFAALVDGKWMTVTGILYYVGHSGDVYETGYAFACKIDGRLRVVGTVKVNYMK